MFQDDQRKTKKLVTEINKFLKTIFFDKVDSLYLDNNCVKPFTLILNNICKYLFTNWWAKIISSLKFVNSLNSWKLK